MFQEVVKGGPRGSQEQAEQRRFVVGGRRQQGRAAGVSHCREREDGAEDETEEGVQAVEHSDSRIS